MKHIPIVCPKQRLWNIYL